MEKLTLISLSNTEILVSSILIAVIIGLTLCFIIPKRPSIKTYVGLALMIIIGIGGYLFSLNMVLTAILVCACAVSLVSFGTNSSHNKDSLLKENRHVVTDKDEIEKMVNDITETLEFFSARKIGAIITFERNTNLNTYINKAVQIDGKVSPELLKTVFFPNTALHDGALIIRGSRVACAAAYYPLTDKTDIPSYYGTRHRAAIGISEDTDAFSVVVSEETGTISYTIGGTITSGISEEALREAISENLLTE